MSLIDPHTGKTIQFNCLNKGRGNYSRADGVVIESHALHLYCKDSLLFPSTDPNTFPCEVLDYSPPNFQKQAPRWLSAQWRCSTTSCHERTGSRRTLPLLICKRSKAPPPNLNWVCICTYSLTSSAVLTSKRAHFFTLKGDLKVPGGIFHNGYLKWLVIASLNDAPLWQGLR